MAFYFGFRWIFFSYTIPNMLFEFPLQNILFHFTFHHHLFNKTHQNTLSNYTFANTLFKSTLQNNIMVHIIAPRSPPCLILYTFTFRIPLPYLNGAKRAKIQNPKSKIMGTFFLRVSRCHEDMWCVSAQQRCSENITVIAQKLSELEAHNHPKLPTLLPSQGVGYLSRSER